MKTSGNQFDYIECNSGQSLCFRLLALTVNKLKLSRYQRTACEETNTTSKATENVYVSKQQYSQAKFNYCS